MTPQDFADNNKQAEKIMDTIDAYIALGLPSVEAQTLTNLERIRKTSPLNEKENAEYVELRRKADELEAEKVK